MSCKGKTVISHFYDSLLKFFLLLSFWSLTASVHIHFHYIEKSTQDINKMSNGFGMTLEMMCGVCTNAERLSGSLIGEAPLRPKFRTYLKH